LRFPAHALTAAAVVLATPAVAQPPIAAALRDSARDDRAFSFTARGPYRPQVPRPEAILGYRIGDRNTQYAEQERVLLAIADAAKDRVRVEEIGATHEGRRMRIYIVSAPENVARLDEIRASLDRLADPRGASQADLDAALARPIPGLGYRQYPRLREEVQSIGRMITGPTSRPTDAQLRRYGELVREAQAVDARLAAIVGAEIARINEAMKASPRIFAGARPIM
jgi:hypothetical protein